MVKAAGGAGVGVTCPRRRAVLEDSPGSDLPENQRDMAGVAWRGWGRGLGLVWTITIHTGSLVKADYAACTH